MGTLSQTTLLLQTALPILAFPSENKTSQQMSIAALARRVIL